MKPLHVCLIVTILRYSGYMACGVCALQSSSFDSISEYYGSEEDDDDIAVLPKNSLDIPPIEINLTEDGLEILN